ncbi:unknown [Prevotella sp. CAG:617]|nr:unknown [Prevotella sp. CAG:617]
MRYFIVEKKDIFEYIKQTCIFINFYLTSISTAFVSSTN